MLRQLRMLGWVAAATALMALPAQATPIIDFSTGPAGTGGTIQWVGANLIGRGIPIGVATVDGAPTNNGVYLVTGTAPGSGGGSFARLDFDTSSFSLQITGCIEGLDIGISVAGACTYPVRLFSGSFSRWNPDGTNGLDGAVGLADSTLNESIGLDVLQYGYLSGFSIAAHPLTRGGAAAEVINTELTSSIAPVPEPATLVLFGTGLLAALKNRRAPKRR